MLIYNNIYNEIYNSYAKLKNNSTIIVNPKIIITYKFYGY